MLQAPPPPRRTRAMSSGASGHPSVVVHHTTQVSDSVGPFSGALGEATEAGNTTQTHHSIHPKRSRARSHCNVLSPVSIPVLNSHTAAPTSTEHDTRDAVAYMERGTNLMKYGRHGYPHFRFVQLDPVTHDLVWFSRKKSSDQTRIHIRDMDEILLGQQTDNFKRHPLRPHERHLTRRSFSVLYDKGRRTLDLVAASEEEYQMWSKGLEHLIRRNLTNYNEELSLSPFPMHVTPTPLSPISSRHQQDQARAQNRGRSRSALGWDEVACPETEVPIVTAKELKDMQWRLSEAERKLEKTSRRAQHAVLQAWDDEHDNVIGDELHSIRERLRRYRVRVEEGGELGLGLRIWRLRVDLTALNNRIGAIVKNKDAHVF